MGAVEAREAEDSAGEGPGRDPKGAQAPEDAGWAEDSETWGLSPAVEDR